MATITSIGAGTPATAVNASVTPVAHASTTVGDLVLVHASIRNSGTGTVNLPTGWSSLINFGNERLIGKIWDGVAIPAISFTGGVANADTIAQAHTFRGVSAEVLTTIASSITQLNGSAANVATPALTVPKDRHLVLAAVWKQDDITTISAFGTVMGLTSVTAGDDAAQAWWYIIQTTAANIGSGTLTVTGGAAAISRAVIVALKPAASIAVAEQDAYPPRVLVSVTDLTIGDSVELYRSVSGVRTAVRGASDASVDDPSFLRIDAELPFGVPVSYVAVVNGVEYTSATDTYDLPGGKVVLSDAVGGSAAEVTIGAWPSQMYEPRSTTFDAGARNIVVSGPMGQYTGAMDLYLETTSSVDNLFDLLRNATEGVIQIRQPGGYDGVDSYVVVTRADKRRFSQDGSDERRLVALDVVEVEGWAEALEAQGFTLGDIADAYDGLTLTNIGNDYASLLLLAQGDFS